MWSNRAACSRETKGGNFFPHSAQVKSGPSLQEHCRSLGATGRQRAIREIKKTKIKHVTYKGPISASWIIWAAGHSWLGGYSGENSSVYFSPWHLLLVRCIAGWSLGYKNPCPDLIRCSYISKTRIKMPKLCSKTRNTHELLSPGKFDYVPNKVNLRQPSSSLSQVQQSGWDRLALSLQTGPHTRTSWAKGKSQITSFWAAGLPYRDLLCPLVTIKHKTGNLALSIPINKKVRSCYICWLVDNQWGCSDFLWPNWEYPSPKAAWSPFCLGGMRDGARERDAILKSWEQTP